ncbi:DUF4920 domain-containing protein [Robertkochia sediminum]|uniref:DUF4920 domain-containing protein n=1 Tax=Robertkochia sediminum TaxID=2785326 RepID=UPI001932173C|nr:DUF4920 domain-containing protein [Robertkochia sediminum]MBL7472279.1 DUF4920 domain-containing protein [Robertkochia sediminum]
MKALSAVFAVMLLLTGCKEKVQEKTTEVAAEQKEVVSFGDGVNSPVANSAEEMAEMYGLIKENDTIQATFQAKVTEVCQMKGCWMKVDLGNDQIAMVRFKDYGFFMPKDLAGKEVIIEGGAFVEEMSVEDRKHYAEDAGSTVEEIEAITEPKKTLSFEATGVVIK